ncbi:aminoacyl-tRNA hydrolase [Corynebacterium incognita]|uniref:Peptidyl-tRNA hydrolase n=1 Tax=Corynebacterium incognita TaxID=2754725 RepID=A0A7G7CNS5_9CORY|nr:aminoacyl-tRNA hydrolase [Corynebacterium incognita]
MGPSLCETIGVVSFIKDFFSRFTRDRGALSRGTAASISSALELDDLNAEWLIVGLGNPGPKYAATRHNVGYMAIDDLLAATGDVLTPVKGVKAQVAPLQLGDAAVLAVRSTTFMNLSGEAVGALAAALDIPAERIIVLHDELDLPAHKTRIKLGGNENGHNGLKSMSEHLGTRDYLRVRMGIGRPQDGQPIVDWVLGGVDSGPGFDEAIATAVEAARLVVTDGLAKAQNLIHSR